MLVYSPEDLDKQWDMCGECAHLSKCLVSSLLIVDEVVVREFFRFETGDFKSHRVTVEMCCEGAGHFFESPKSEANLRPK